MKAPQSIKGKRFFILSLLFLWALQGWAQQSFSVDTLEWHANRKLTWNDFKAEPIMLPGIYGEINCLLPAQYFKEQADSQTHFGVKAIFDGTSSWIHPSKKQPMMLQYFQLHFDLFEWQARKLRKTLAETKWGPDPRKGFQDIYTTQFNELTARIRLFKKETKLGTLPVALKKWRTTVDSALHVYEPFVATQ